MTSTIQDRMMEGLEGRQQASSLLEGYYDRYKSAANPYIEFERTIAQLAYPATMPNKLRRLFAKELADLVDKYQHGRNKLLAENVSNFDKIQFKDLPADERKLVKDYQKAREAYYAAEKKMRDLSGQLAKCGFEIYGFGSKDLPVEVTRKRDDETMKRLQLDLKQRREAYARQGVADATAFEQIIRDWATEQIVKTKLKLPQSFRDTLDRLRAHKALLPAPADLDLAATPRHKPLERMHCNCTEFLDSGTCKHIDARQAIGDVITESIDLDAQKAQTSPQKRTIKTGATTRRSQKKAR